MRPIDSNDQSWIQLYSGPAFWPCDPRPEEVSIYDIAHALAMGCRWSGHTRKHFSVAQHSVLVSYHVPKEDALAALLHDASEAYIQDIARPTKPLLTNYKALEGALMKVILQKFGLPETLPLSVKEADDMALFTEARDLLRPPARPWTYVPKVSPVQKKRLRPWPMWWSEFRFLWRFGELTGTRWATVKGWAKLKWEDFISDWTRHG